MIMINNNPRKVWRAKMHISNHKDTRRSCMSIVLECPRSHLGVSENSVPHCTQWLMTIILA